MQKNSFRFLSAGIACVVFLSSCKKEDPGSPVIQITSPVSGQQFNAGDTVYVAAVVSDSRQLTSVSVGLLNSNYISAAPTVSTNVSANNADIRMYYVIPVSLATGNYFIVVTAGDGHTETNAFVTIHIAEMPLVRKGVYLLSAGNNISFTVSKLDSLNQSNPVFSIPGDYSGSAIYSGYHEIFTIGKTTGAFNAFDLNTNSLLWTHPATSTSVPSFQNLFLDKGIVYVSYYDGNIKGYDRTNSQVYVVQQQGYFIPDVILKNDDYFFAELYYRTSHQHKIGVFYHGSGVERQESITDIDIKNMYTLDHDHLLLFGNDTTTGQSKTELYDIPGNGCNLLSTFAGGVIYCTVQVDQYSYLVAHSNGISLYDYSMNGFTPFVTGIPVYSLTYDKVNREIFACSGNQVHVYNLTTSSLEYTVANADSVMDVRVLYNK